MALDYKIMGQRIKDARKNKGFSQIYVAEMVDVSDVYISRVERGRVQINLKRLSEICTLLDVSIAQIVTGAEEGSKQYLNKELYDIIEQCTPKKQKLIYDIAKLILEASYA